MSKTNKKNVGTLVNQKGVTFRVWAPFAEQVSVSGTFNNWSRAPLTSEGNGYWSVEIEGAQPGEEYKYVIKNGDRELYKNDPRSLQVTTDAGNSVIVDPHFDWTDDNFHVVPRSQQIIYELHVGTFHRADPAASGTFGQASEKLDYLQQLGVTVIELMPINSMSMDRGWGYAPDYIYAVESLYGGRGEFLSFVNEAHARGIAVILDVVYNHFGPNGHLDVWQFDGWSENDKGGIYFYNDWRSQTPWGDTRPDFGRSEVRQYILDNVKMWLHDSHLDGLRLDSTIYMRNVKGNNDDQGNDIAEAWQTMQEITTLAKKIKPDALLIAEDIGWNEYITKPRPEGGAGFTSQWEINFPRVLRNAVDAVHDRDRNLRGICDELSHHYNGDVYQRVTYSDSHDSAANGNARLNEEVSPGNSANVFARQRSLLAAAVVLTSPGIPMLFQGQEFMQGGSFNDWEALDWDKTEQFEGIVLAYKHLIAIRKNIYGNTKGLQGQSVSVKQLDEQNKVLAYHRWDNGGPTDDVMVVLNFANRTHGSYDIGFPNDGAWRVRFNSSWKGYAPDFKEATTSEVVVKDGKGTMSLAPYAAFILSRDA
jgi:1,4-alpha-glucan branching enzyme